MMIIISFAVGQRQEKVIMKSEASGFDWLLTSKGTVGRTFSRTLAKFWSFSYNLIIHLCFIRLFSIFFFFPRLVIKSMAVFG